MPIAGSKLLGNLIGLCTVFSVGVHLYNRATYSTLGPFPMWREMQPAAYSWGGFAHFLSSDWIFLVVINHISISMPISRNYHAVHYVPSLHTFISPSIPSLCVPQRWLHSRLLRPHCVLSLCIMLGCVLVSSILCYVLQCCVLFPRLPSSFDFLILSLLLYITFCGVSGLVCTSLELCSIQSFHRLRSE